MIDDRGGKKSKPVAWVSVVDMEALGFEFVFQELEKTKDSGEVVTAIKILSVKKDGKPFPKNYTAEFLHVLGLDTLGEGKRWWVCPKKRHRCLSQKEPVYDYRIMSYERSDKSYLQSGRASLDIQLWTSNVSDMQDQADKLSNGGDD